MAFLDDLDACGGNYAGFPVLVVDALARLHQERQPYTHNKHSIPGKIEDYLGERILGWQELGSTGEGGKRRLVYAVVTESGARKVSVRGNGSKVLGSRRIVLWGE